MTPKTYKVHFTTCTTTGIVATLKACYVKFPLDPSVPSSWRGKCPECGKTHKVQRIITRSIESSNHVCDEKCIHARGQRCECACGGENHGIGGLGIVVARAAAV